MPRFYVADDARPRRQSAADVRYCRAMIRTEAEPIHVFRFCPRCGATPLAPHATYGFACAGCGFLFFLNVASAAAAIIRDDNGRVLLTRRARDPERGKLDIPGGFVDWNETAEQALAREIREELQLDIESLSYFCSVTNVYEFRGLNYRTLDLYFTCAVRDFAPLSPGDDIDGCLWVDPRRLDQEAIGFDSVRRALRKLAGTASAEA
jgi:NAD+ diphosphatase